MGSLSVKKCINYESLQFESLSGNFIYTSSKTNCKAVSILRKTQKLLDDKSCIFRLD